MNFTLKIPILKVLFLFLTLSSFEQEGKSEELTFTDHCIHIHYQNLSKKTIKCLADYTFIAYKTAKDAGLQLPDKIDLSLEQSPGIAHPIVYSTATNQIKLLYIRTSDIEISLVNPNPNIYGVCHELGALILTSYFQNFTLPKDFKESWQHLFASSMVDAIYSELRNSGKDSPNICTYGMKRYLEAANSSTIVGKKLRSWLQLDAIIGLSGFASIFTNMNTLLNNSQTFKNALNQSLTSVLITKDDQKWIEKYLNPMLQTSTDPVLCNNQSFY